MGDVASVKGFADTVHLDGTVDDSAVFTLRFESGAHAVANINWNVGIGVDDIEVYGTIGRLRCSPLNTENLTLETKSEGVKPLPKTPLPHTHTGLVKDYVNHIRTSG